MTLEDLRDICLALPAATEDVKWENDLCFCIGEKMFLVASLGKSPTSVSFKATEEVFNELTEQEGCKPAPYLARYKWVYVDDLNRLSVKAWKAYAQAAYTMVAAKLPKKVKSELGLSL